ncbi:MAG: DUF1614 domain-containing protein [Planctomycetaceae bacterium]|nr:DUF1614 domain-containing protein [Planctomycetales bacterium]MCB9924215.1 DUF1614 domain-containing protein [Planctomycetaceae bacterium]
MQPTPLHYFPLAWPFAMGLFLLVAFLVALVQFNILVFAYAKLGVNPRHVTLLLLLTLLGASINIPVAQLPEEQIVEHQHVHYWGVEYVVPILRHWPGTIIAVNVGGAIVPTVLSIYLIVKHRLFVRGLIGTAIVALFVHQFAYPVKGLGIVTPTLTPPLIAASVGLLLGWRSAAPLAYSAGCLGTLIGADLMNLGAIRGLGAPVASIGGAGTYDGIFVTGILAFLLTWSPPRSTRETAPPLSEYES